MHANSQLPGDEDYAALPLHLLVNQKPDDDESQQ